MSTIRLWNLESSSDTQAVSCLKDALASYLPLENLSIHASGKRAIRKLTRKDDSFSDRLRCATDYYLKQAACVIFVIDNDDPMAAPQRRQDPNSLINHVERIVRDNRFAGRVFLAPAAQELDSWLPVVRKSVEADSKAWREKWERISAHFHEAFANTPEDEVIRDFDKAVAEVRRERT